MFFNWQISNAPQKGLTSSELRIFRLFSAAAKDYLFRLFCIRFAETLRCFRSRQPGLAVHLESKACDNYVWKKQRVLLWI